MTTRLVEELLRSGSAAGDLLAALGPAIGPCCYEVGEELREAFGPGGEAFFRSGPRGRPHLDVRAANVRQLLSAGLDPSRIHHAPRWIHDHRAPRQQYGRNNISERCIAQSGIHGKYRRGPKNTCDQAGSVCPGFLRWNRLARGNVSKEHANRGAID